MYDTSVFYSGFPKTEFQGQLQSLNHSLSESGEQMNQTRLSRQVKSSECRDKARYDLYSKMPPNSNARNE